MAKNNLTDEELLAQLEGIGASNTTAAAAAATRPSPTKAKPTTNSAAAPTGSDDPLAALENLAKTKPLSRPNTPKLAGSTRNSDDRVRVPRRSAESSTPLAQELTPTSEDEAAAHAAHYQQQHAQQHQQAEQSSWWGGIFATASAAVKQAEAAVKEIQKNEDAQKWADQVKGNVGMLRGFGGELRSRAIPTFTSLLNTIAPPISQHERLQIHITHDFIGYPALDPTIYTIFSRVMSQVEGGDLLVIQRGSESRGPSGASRAGWSDGPWWRDGQTKRDLGIINGLSEGTKLVRANAEAYATEYFASRGGLEHAIKQANEIPPQDNPVRSSDIFLAIQAVGIDDDEKLFQAATEEKSSGEMVEDKAKDEGVCFAVYLHDPVHGITFRTITQAFPRKWTEWLDAEQDPSSETHLPVEIAEIVENGGIDPREWISEWVEEVIGTGVGIIAQRYVAKRMGVGEGGIGKGKARQPAVDVGAGELARAI